MADALLSQLNEITSIDEEDLLAVSQHQGGGSYANGSRKIKAKNFDMVAGRRDYGAREFDPTSPTPQGGDRYYNWSLNSEMIYDSSRSKWLTVNTVILYFGRAGNTTVGTYYRTPSDDLAFSATIGYYSPNDGTVVGIGYTRDDNDQATFEVTDDGATIASLVSTATTGASTSINSDYAAGSVLGVRNGDNIGDNTTTNVGGWIAVKGRSPSSATVSSSSSSESSSESSSSSSST